MDMTQQPTVLSRNPHTEGRALGSHHTPRPESHASTHSGSSPRASQGKASMDIERNTRPFPDKFALSASREHFLTSSSRMASIPVPLPSHLTMAQPVSSTSTSPGSSDSHTSIPSLQTSARSSELADTLSSSSCAAAIAIAARAAAADSTPQATPRATLSLSPFSPAYNHLSCSRQRVHTAPQQGATNVEALDASSLDVLSDGLDTPLPPMKRASNHPASLTPGFPSFRTTQSLSAPTPFPTKFSIEGVSARMSPAIISRQPQHPILSRPPISPTTSSPAIDPSRLRSRSLRSVPALPMQGSDDQEPAEHDNADLDDLDEEDEGVADGDEDAEEGTPEAELLDTASEDGESTSGPHSSGASESRPGNLPAIIVTPLDMSFLDANKRGTIRQDDKTPKGDQVDYFNSKIPRSNYIQSTDSRQLPSARPSATTPTVPASTPTFSVLTPAWATSGSRALLSPTTPRSGMYHQATRSMSDMAEILRQHHTPEMAAKTPKSPFYVTPSARPILRYWARRSRTSQLGPSIRRRLSMPTFGPSTAPPPYPEFRFGERGLIIQPRDEEGCECLPRYTNDIYLRAIMPRKMEFSAPGVQARDRKVAAHTLAFLEGTAFRVYRCPPTATGKGLIGNLWEKTVGVGDISAPVTPENFASAKVKERERVRDARQTKFDGAGQHVVRSLPRRPPSQSHQWAVAAAAVKRDSDAQSSPSSTRSRLIQQHFRRKNRASSGASDGPSTPRPDFQARRSSSALQQNTPDSSWSQGASSLTSGSPQTSRTRTPSNPATPMHNSPRAPRPPRIKRRHLWVDDPDVPLPQEENLLHSYALHNAESGLGTDYVKRQNVIRIRMEGEQFLLQARDVASVVDWIEVRSVALGGDRPKQCWTFCVIGIIYLFVRYGVFRTAVLYAGFPGCCEYRTGFR